MDNISTSSTTQKESSSIEQFTFTGKGSEYFGIWIVNILLTIVTLGIYSAWAKVRNKQYFYGNTLLNNSSFEYTASPINILKGRLIAVAALVVYQLSIGYVPILSSILITLFVILIPWFVMKSLAFNARYSQYRNIRFSFDQDLLDAYKVMMFIPLAGYILIVAIGVAFYFLIENIFAFFPYLMFIMARYTIDNHNYGNSSFKLMLKNANFYYAIYLKLAGIVLLGLIVVFIIGIFASFMFASLSSINPNSLSSFDPSNTAALIALLPLIIVVYAFIIFAYAFLIAFVKAQTYNAIYSNTKIGSHTIVANMSVGGLTLLYVTNTLAIIFTLGLFTPWALVRSARFKAQSTSIKVSGTLNDFINNQETHQSSLGEEIGEVFDLDIGL